MLFKDRNDAGQKLALALEQYAAEDVIVFALPRGGVELGAVIARKLGAPLDLVLTKKIGHPMNPEYAICAVSETGEPICNPAERSNVDPEWLQSELDRIRAELKRRRKTYLGEVKLHAVLGKTIILADDGIATGYTMMAAIAEMRQRGAKKIIVAIPVAPSDTAQVLKNLADELVCLEIDPYYLGSVGSYYQDFRQVEDSEVISLLKAAENSISDE